MIESNEVYENAAAVESLSTTSAASNEDDEASLQSEPMGCIPVVLSSSRSLQSDTSGIRHGTVVGAVGAIMSEQSRRQLQVTCCPNNTLSAENLPVLFCLMALILTHAGSWTCSYFNGADIGFTGSAYGLWSLEDVTGKCQLWDILFFSYSLDSALEGARFCSMMAMLVGLANLTTMLQAQQAHLVSWGVGFCMVILLLVSLTTSSIYNIWIVFWLFTYIVLTLIVRALFIHPVHRRISARGTMYIGSLFIFCSVVCLLTLMVLLSDYCTCDSLSTLELEGRIEGDPCEGECFLGPAGYVMISASAFWLATAVVTYKFGVQKKEIRVDPSKAGILYTKTVRASITTNAIRAATVTVGSVKKAGRTVVKFGSLHGSCNSVDFSAADGLDNNPENIEAHMQGTEDDSVEDENTAADMQAIEDADQSFALSQAIAEEKDETDEEVADQEWHHRSFCKMLCCDLRISKRSKKERWLFWIFRAMVGVSIGLYIFLLVVLIGGRMENRNAEQAPDTSVFFVTEVVCAFDENDVTAPFVTLQSPQEAHAANLTIAHCGACSFCSNMADIETYVLTRKTIAKSAKKCGTKAIFGPYRKLADCLEDRIGFSRECTYCWADNLKSTAENCLFTCMKTLFTGFMSNNNVPGAGGQGWLNQCLQCDEKLSGPDFVTCSGVARRRLGIASEIERNPEEQCTLVDLDWIDYLDAPTDDGDL